VNRLLGELAKRSKNYQRLKDSHIVLNHRWNLDFEFDNFSDREVAQAVNSCIAARYKEAQAGKPSRVSAKEVAKVRAPGDWLQALLAGKKVEISKVDLAEELAKITVKSKKKRPILEKLEEIVRKVGFYGKPIRDEDRDL